MNLFHRRVAARIAGVSLLLAALAGVLTWTSVRAQTGAGRGSPALMVMLAVFVCSGVHNCRVAWISATLGEAVGLSGSRMQELIAGSFLHDAGKIGIPDAILLKPGKLTPDEMDIMRTHVTLGEEIVSGPGWLSGGKEVMANHHEKWDGSGYPRQLSGDAIPLGARSFAIADVFDALCSSRPYKDPFPVELAMEILHQSSGSHFGA